MTQTELNAMKLALSVIQGVSDTMTVGFRYSNEGQAVLDALPILREVLEKASAFEDKLKIAQDAINNLECDEAYEQDCNVCTIQEFLYEHCK